MIFHGSNQGVFKERLAPQLSMLPTQEQQQHDTVGVQVYSASTSEIKIWAGALCHCNPVPL